MSATFFTIRQRDPPRGDHALHMPHQVVSPAQLYQSPPQRGGWPAFYRRAWFVGAMSGVLGLIAGAGLVIGATGDPSDTAEYQALVSESAASEQAVAQLETELSTVEGNLPSREEDVRLGLAAIADREKDVTLDLAAVADREKEVKQLAADRQAELDQRARGLDKRAADLRGLRKDLAKARKDVRARERQVKAIETRVEAKTIAGEGVYRVGTDMQAGTYRSVNNVDCRWRISSDANGSNIIEKETVSGPALVNVPVGRYFSTSSCSDWVLQP
jgi:hypothetical protein